MHQRRRMSRAKLAARTRIGVILVAFGAVALTGCFGDPAPNPAEAPLEVVVEGCVLNRANVAPGMHEVSVLNHAEKQPGELVVSGEDGTEVLRLSVGGTAQLLTTDQAYTFRCSVGVDQSSSTLESKPQ